eukprot:3559144-Prymnesium_polylepis.1
MKTATRSAAWGWCTTRTKAATPRTRSTALRFTAAARHCDEGLRLRRDAPIANHCRGAASFCSHSTWIGNVAAFFWQLCSQRRIARFVWRARAVAKEGQGVEFACGSETNILCHQPAQAGKNLRMQGAKNVPGHLGVVG